MQRRAMLLAWTTVLALVVALLPMNPTLLAAGGLSNPNPVLTPASLPLPPVGTPFVDPTFGTTLRRVSSTSDQGGFETQIYSQLQAFSSDNAYLLLTGSNGYVVRRVGDLGLLSGLDTDDWNAPRWHPARPHEIVHFDTNADEDVQVQFTNVDTRTTTTVFTFPAQYQRIRVNQSFDELSEDGRWLAGMVARNDGQSVLFALNIESRALGAVLALPDLYAGPCAPDPVWGAVEPDWIGVSPLGRYLVIQWTRDGTDRCSGLEAFDIQTGAFVGRIYDGHQHGDLALSADGLSEVFMTLELYHPSGNLSIGLRDLPGTATASVPRYVQVLSWGTAEHVSCRGPRGICLITAGSMASNGWNPFEAELFIQRMDGTVLRLAHHRSTECGYWLEPRASISRDGRLVVFSSDWGRNLGCSGDGLGRGDPYIVDLGAGDPPDPPPTTTPTSTLTPTPTPTPVPATCTPRPIVRIQTASAGTGALQVTITAGTTTSLPNNRLQALRFGAASNARIDVAGRVGETGNVTITLPAGTQQTSFVVRRASPGLATTVPLVVVDGCGAWRTFVGGGPDAFR